VQAHGRWQLLSQTTTSLHLVRNIAQRRRRRGVSSPARWRLVCTLPSRGGVAARYAPADTHGSTHAFAAAETPFHRCGGGSCATARLRLRAALRASWRECVQLRGG
jgi:hypothetical protein